MFRSDREFFAIRYENAEQIFGRTDKYKQPFYAADYQLRISFCAAAIQNVIEISFQILLFFEQNALINIRKNTVPIDVVIGYLLPDLLVEIRKNTFRILFVRNQI